MANFTTFLGNKMSQDSGAVEFWEKVLCKNDYKRLIEFGTYKGAMSVFFLLWSMTRKADFKTYDTAAHKFNRLAYFLKLPLYFRKLDIFEHEKEIGELIAKLGMSIVYCDNGDKSRELKVFSKYLKKGDLIGVHDWGTELSWGDVPIGLDIVSIHHREPNTIIFKKL